MNKQEQIITENEAINAIENDLKWHDSELKPIYKKALKLAIQALKKIQVYETIGTAEEFLTLKETHNIHEEWKKIR